MPQVKKQEVRDAILKAAAQLFSKQGYTRTTLPQIAEASGSTTVYSYFGSKLEILYEVYTPWMRKRLAKLERELQAVSDPLDRLRLLLRTLWRDIPNEKKGFANNIMQALTTATPEDGYRSTLLEWIEGELRRMVLACLPPQRQARMTSPGMIHLLVMAFDGFILYHRLDPKRPCDDETIDTLSRLMLGLPMDDGDAQGRN
jgi:AcrR family transcriptional regulator